MCQIGLRIWVKATHLPIQVESTSEPSAGVGYPPDVQTVAEVPYLS